ncbi:hypothetical protein [Agrococcus casei]|uniref:hypothetical protein n=1 Tax=Agrococcus casei TaxID=343512 RepID=UPI003F9336B0
MVIIALIFGACSAFTPSSSNGSPSTSVLEIEAKIWCEDAVRESLKAPSSADFVDVNSNRQGAQVIVNGKVDAQNSFGAMIRNEFQCTVSIGDDGELDRGRVDFLG